MLAKRAKGAAANRARYYLELAEELSSDRSLMQPSLLRASLGSSSTTTCTEVPVAIKGDSAQSMRTNAISKCRNTLQSQSVCAEAHPNLTPERVSCLSPDVSDSPTEALDSKTPD